MRKALLSALGAALLACFARTPAQAQAADSIQLSAGSTIRVMLEKWVDARKNKVGDEVVAKVTENVKSDGRVVLPKGSKVIGHVTLIKARTKEEQESAVGIIFERAVLKDGREVPLPLEIQAVAPDEELTPPPAMGTAPGTAGGTTGAVPPMPVQGNAAGPMADPNAGTPGRIASPSNGAEASRGELTSTGGLTSSCHGVLGIDGLALIPETANSTQGSVIASLRRNVHLDGRTQMMLRVKDR